MTNQEPVLTAAGGGQSWRWQLRDKNGQWVEMGAKVKFLSQGREFTGKVVGSPFEGVAAVQVDGGNKVNVETNRLTVDAPKAPEAPKAPAPPPKKGLRGLIEWSRQDRKAQIAKEAAELQKDRQRRIKLAEDMALSAEIRRQEVIGAKRRADQREADIRRRKAQRADAEMDIVTAMKIRIAQHEAGLVVTYVKTQERLRGVRGF